MSMETFRPAQIVAAPSNQPPPSANAAADALVRWAEAGQAAHGLASALVSTQMVPASYRKDDNGVHEATAVILLGAEVGLSPIAALQSFYVVRGQSGMYTRAMVALVLSRGHEIWTVSESDDKVTVAGRRRGSDHTEEVTWSLARAAAAGLSKSNPNYRSQPRAMLWARAAGEVARRIAPDVLMGIPETSAEDLGTSDARAADRQSPAATTRVQRRPASKPGPDIVTPPSQRFERAPDVAGSDDPADVPDASPAKGDEIAAEEVETTEAQPDDVETTETTTDEQPNDEELAESEPLITGAQRARLHAAFNGAGLERPAYIAWTSTTLGRDVETTNDLTVTEASYLLDRIEQIRATRPAPPVEMPDVDDPTTERHP